MTKPPLSKPELLLKHRQGLSQDNLERPWLLQLRTEERDADNSIETVYTTIAVLSNQQAEDIAIATAGHVQWSVRGMTTLEQIGVNTDRLRKNT